MYALIPRETMLTTSAIPVTIVTMALRSVEVMTPMGGDCPGKYDEAMMVKRLAQHAGGAHTRISCPAYHDKDHPEMILPTGRLASVPRRAREVPWRRDDKLSIGSIDDIRFKPAGSSRVTVLVWLRKASRKSVHSRFYQLEMSDFCEPLPGPALD